MIPSLINLGDLFLPSITIMLNFGLLGLLISLAFLGFFRSVVTGVKPSFLLDQKKVQDEWLSRSSFSAIMLPIMGFVVFVFNAFAWSVYGLISIFEFAAFILKAIWWLIVWIWNEFIHPVFFLIIKLLWHYIVIWSWRFFKLALTRIPEAFSISTFKNGFISVLAISLIVLFFLYLSSILQQPWIIILLAFAFIFAVAYFSLFTLYDDEKRTFNDFWTGTVISRLGILIVVSILSASIVTVLHMFAGTAIQLPVLGLSYPISLVLIVILVVSTVSALVINAIAPAYTVQNNGEFDTKDFLINTGIRLPRLIGSVPFLWIGGFLTSLITIVIGVFLWWSTNSIKDTFSTDALNKMQVELDMANSHFKAFYNANAQANMARDFSQTRVKRISILESRVYALNIFKEDWLMIINNLPKGVRSTKIEKSNLERYQRTYADRSTKLAEEIGELERSISNKLADARIDPNNISLEESIEIDKNKLETIKLQRGQLESQFILNTSLTQARIGSIKYTNVMWVIGTFFAMLGLVLLMAIVLTPFWIYRTKFFFDLYDFHHDGKSYLTEQIEYYQGRNKNQPLLGFFVLLVIILIIVAIIIL
ncbi:MAG: hypothetical protein RBT74_01920 [Tenuifilaceae bacterium]|jgi:hypothetical protein|nr:hypothetical protein [Tenuifilaceae bacterium]